MNVKVDVHSELLYQYPWSSGPSRAPTRSTRRTPAASTRGALTFRDQGKLPHPSPAAHDWAAAVGSDRQATGERGPHGRHGHFGPQEPVEPCPRPSEQAKACDDGPTGAAPAGSCASAVPPPRGRHAHGLGRRRRLGTDRGRPGRARAALVRDPARALARQGPAPASAPRAGPGSPCPATRCCGGHRVGQAEPARPHAGGPRAADRDWTRASATRAQTARVARVRWVAPAIRTTRGCSPRTPSTRPSRASPSASSRPSRPTTSRCATSR